MDDCAVMFESLFAKSGLSLDRLRSFLEMAEAGGISKAAPGDPVRQSQISRQIRELEGFFGTELAQRRGKGLVLTPAGQRLAGLVRGQLQGLDDFRREQEGQPKAFVLGAGASTLEWLVTPRLPALSAALGGALLRTGSCRSRPLVEAVREGRIDLAVVRRDALADASNKNCRPLVKLSFHLCVPEALLPRGARAADLSDPGLWPQIPFAAGRDGGQLDAAIREAMAKAGLDFQPRFECGSMLQVRQLVVQGSCAAVLPSIALPGLDAGAILVSPFAPLAGYGRTLVLHWNPRQVEMRGVETRRIAAAAAILAGK
jgi:DNA-binding transcriptional LysR family regulator